MEGRSTGQLSGGTARTRDGWWRCASTQQCGGSIAAEYRQVSFAVSVSLAVSVSVSVSVAVAVALVLALLLSLNVCVLASGEEQGEGPGCCVRSAAGTDITVTLPPELMDGAEEEYEEEGEEEEGEAEEEVGSNTGKGDL